MNRTDTCVKSRVTALLTPAEIAAVQARSDGRAAVELAISWAILAGAFALAGMAATWWAILLSVLLIGARQMGLAVLMHECAHRTFFKTPSLNEHIGQWLTAAPMNVPMHAYREIHLRHHRFGGTPRDPDLTLIRGYPATPASLARKFARDLCGLTGIKDIIGQAMRFKIARDYRFLVVHAAMALILWASGIGWTYALWWIGYVSIYQVVLRLRLIGEHGTCIDRGDLDPRAHTTTVPANFIERLFIAPHCVSYHVEHHFMPSVPIYRLRKLHKIMQSRDYFAVYPCVRANYVEILCRAISGNGASNVAPLRTVR
jgi:fatty acid desaturase